MEAWHLTSGVIVDLPQRHSECEVDTCPLQQQQAAHLNQELLSPCAPGAAHQAGEVLGGRRAARPAVGAGVPMGGLDVEGDCPWARPVCLTFTWMDGIKNKILSVDASSVFQNCGSTLTLKVLSRLLDK